MEKTWTESLWSGCWVDSSSCSVLGGCTALIYVCLCSCCLRGEIDGDLDWAVEVPYLRSPFRLPLFVIQFHEPNILTATICKALCQAALGIEARNSSLVLIYCVPEGSPVVVTGILAGKVFSGFCFQKRKRQVGGWVGKSYNPSVFIFTFYTIKQRFCRSCQED